MNPDQDPEIEALSDGMVFVEHGIEHPFQHEGGDFSRSPEVVGLVFGLILDVQFGNPGHELLPPLAIREPVCESGQPV